MALVVGALPSAAQEDATAISADGVPIRYTAAGSGGPALVLVHGWSNNRSFWQSSFADLARSQQVIALDLAGFGESGDNREHWSMQAFGRDVEAVVRTVDPARVILVGFSMGAAVALEAARMLPEKTVAVVLVDQFHDPEFQYSERLVDGFVRQIRETWHDSAAVRALAFSPPAPDSLIQRYISSTPPTPPAHWWTALRNFFEWSNANLVKTLSMMDVPVIAINSRRMITEKETFQKYVPSFRVATIADVGHLGVLWERPEEFRRLLVQAVGELTNAEQ